MLSPTSRENRCLKVLFSTLRLIWLFFNCSIVSSDSEARIRGIARPNKVKMDMQARYGAQVRSLIHNLFQLRRLISDGTTGRSLEHPVALLAQAIARVQEKGHEPDFANNSALIYAATFGAVKEKTGRGWSDHTCEAEYQQAISIARQFLLRLREQLQWRPRR